VCLQRRSLLANSAPQPPDEHFTIIKKPVGSSESQHTVTVALMLREHQTLEVVIDDLVPRFFVEGLPVVGTEQLPLPMIIHSAEFQVEAGRTGLHLEAKETPQQIINWNLVSLVPNVYIALLEYGSRKNWGSIHLLANMRECPSKSWLNSGEFTKIVVQPVVQEILNNPNIRLVRTIHGNYVSVNDAAIIRDDLDGKLFDMLLTWKPSKHKLVEREVSDFWSGALVTMAKLLGTPVEELPACWSIECLASEVSHCDNLKVLAGNVELKQGEDVADWLNKFIGLIIASGRKSLLTDKPLLPNQKETLCMQSALSRDPGVDEELKDIATAAGIDERAKFLFRQISLPNGMLKDRTELEVLNTLLGSSNQLPPEQNAKLLAWLTLRQQYHERINSYPVFTLGSTQRMDKNHPLLKPLARWSGSSAGFGELFPKDFVLAEAYKDLTDECWKVLENLGFVYASLIYSRDEKDLEKLVLEVPSEEVEEEHEHEVNVKVTDLVFLDEKGKGIIDTVKGSKPRARKFLEFIFAYLLNSDSSWKQAVPVPCSCGKEHKVFTCSWLRTLKENQWLPLRGGRHGYATAETIATIIDESLFNKLTQDEDAAIFLQRLEISVGDLFRVKITDPSERLRADRLAAKMYAQDSQMRVLLSHVLDDADFRELAQKHLEQKRLTQRNREVGTLVEDLIKRALGAEHISVKRTGIGSDYEVEYDFVENGQEQGLAVGKHLLEVKSTSTDDVRMTLTQGGFAVSPPSEYAGYILCVCPVTSDTVTELDIKNQARFMFDIGSAVKQALDNANKLQSIENNLQGAGAQGVQLEIGVSKKRLKVSRKAWLQGLDFDNAVNRLKRQPVGP